MATFKEEIRLALSTDHSAELNTLVDRVVSKTLEGMGIQPRTEANAVRTTQLKLRGYLMADVARVDHLEPRVQALRDAIAASPTPLAASTGKFTPNELLTILEARAEAFQIAGARDLKTSIRAGDELDGLKKILMTQNHPYIVDQCDRILATTGLLYG